MTAGSVLLREATVDDVETPLDFRNDETVNRFMLRRQRRAGGVSSGVLEIFSIDTIAPDAAVTADAAAIRAGTPRQIDGRHDVATFFDGSAQATLPVFIDERPASAWFHRGKAVVLFDFAVLDGLVHRITFRAEPEVLARVARRAVSEKCR